jgi:hypothetical protein
MDTRLLTYLQADDNALATGLCYDQPAAPSDDLLCVLRHLDAARRVRDELMAAIEAHEATMPEPHRSRFTRDVADAVDKAA